MFAAGILIFLSFLFYIDFLIKKGVFKYTRIKIEKFKTDELHYVIKYQFFYIIELYLNNDGELTHKPYVFGSVDRIIILRDYRNLIYEYFKKKRSGDMLE